MIEGISVIERTWVVRNDITALVHVIDPAGRSAPGVTVSLINSSRIWTGSSRTWVTDATGVLTIPHAQRFPLNIFEGLTASFGLAFPFGNRVECPIDPSASADYECTLQFPPCGSIVFESDVPINCNLYWQALGADGSPLPEAWNEHWPYVAGTTETIPNVGLGLTFEYFVGNAKAHGPLQRIAGPTKAGEVVAVRVK